MKLITIILATTISYHVAIAQNNWTMPIQEAEKWLSGETDLRQIQQDLPDAFQLLYEDSNLLEFQFEHRGKSEEVLIEHDSTGINSIRYTTRYDDKDNLMQQLKESGYKVLGAVSDNLYSTQRFISPNGKVVITLEAHRYYDTLIMTKQPTKKLVVPADK